MSASNAFINWSSVVITPQGGSAITLVGVTSVDFQPASQLMPFYGDALLFPRLMASKQKSRGCTIKLSNSAQALASAIEDKPCTIVAVQDDAINGHAASGGGLTHTLVNAVCGGRGVAGANNAYADNTLNFSAFATSDADPYTVTAL